MYGSTIILFNNNLIMDFFNKIKMFGGKGNGAPGTLEKSAPGAISEAKIEKARKRKDNDPQLKRAYDSFLGKKDSKGNDMQEKLLEFLATHSSWVEPVYRRETEDFEVRDHGEHN